MQESFLGSKFIAMRKGPYTFTATFIQEAVAEGHSRLRFHVPLRRVGPQEAVPLRRNGSKSACKTRNPAYRQVSFWIPKELHEAVKIRVIEERDSGGDQSDLFADALRSYLAGHGKLM